jgi:hypothetical protein
VATLLPNGKQQFSDQNGTPLAGGSVYFYIPWTTTPKDTYQDSGATILNTNPVILDASGEAIIFGSGTYRQVVYDSAGNLIWDQLTADTAVGGVAWGGLSSGTPNAQFIAASSFSQQDGQEIAFIAGFTNTGALTIAPGGGAGIAVLNDAASGPTPMTGGEIVAGNAYTLLYDQARGAFHVSGTPQSIPTTFADNTFNIYDDLDPTKKLAFQVASVTTATTRTVTAQNASGVMMLTGAGQTSILSGSTTDLGASPTIDVIITGNNGITNFGTVAAGTRRKGYFSGTPTITYNATSMILPTLANIPVVAGDSFEAISLGSGNWKVLTYTRASGQALAISGIGVGQTWQDVHASRAVGTSYQNTTNNPIMVALSASSPGNWQLQVSSDNSTWLTTGINNNVAQTSATTIVPVNWYYRLINSAGIASWIELR